MEDRLRFDIQRFADDADADSGGAEGSAETASQQSEPANVVSKDEFDRVNRELEQVRQQLQEAQRQLMDPRYIQWLAQQNGLVEPQAPQAVGAQAASVTPEVEEEPDFEKMSPKEFARWLREQVKREVMQEVHPQIQSVAQNAEVARAQMEIEHTSRKYPDFWMYRQQMIQVVQEYEARGVRLAVEDAYHIAKGRYAAAMQSTQPRPVAPPRQRSANAQPATEKTTVSTTATSKGQLSAAEAFEEAWKRAGLDKVFGE